MPSLYSKTYNLVAYLIKNNQSEGFHETIDFLNHSPIHFALTVAPKILKTYVHQFWWNAEIQERDGLEVLRTVVDENEILVNEGVIRTVLKLEDDDGVINISDAAIVEGLDRLGYERREGRTKLHKGMFSPQWKFLIHTLLMCVSNKTTGFDEFPSKIASAIICLSEGRKFNWSRMIFEDFSNEPPLGPVNTGRSGEDMLEHLKELMVKCTKLEGTISGLQELVVFQGRHIRNMKHRVFVLEKVKRPGIAVVKKVRKHRKKVHSSLDVILEDVT